MIARKKAKITTIIASLPEHLRCLAQKDHRDGAGLQLGEVTKGCSGVHTLTSKLHCSIYLIDIAMSVYTFIERARPP